MNLENLKIECISLQSKRNERYMKILPYYKNLNIKEKIAIDGSDKVNIIKLQKEMNIKFDNLASKNNIALFLKSVLLWKKHHESDNNYTIIIEDDVIPINNISEKFYKITKELPKDFDICVMTGVVFGKPKYYSDLLYGKTSFSCIGAYLLSKNGAGKLIEFAKSDIIKTHNSGGVLDYWICCNKDQLNFYKTKEDLFELLNIPSSLTVSRCKFLENNLATMDSILKNNYIFTFMLNNFGINGKITVSYYLFFNFLINYLLGKLIGFTFSVIILITTYLVDISYYNYLLEEKSNKLIELLISFIIFIFF